MPGVLEGAPRYVVERQIGSGGMGVVYLGEMHSQAGRRRVAIKRLKTATAGDEAATARMVAEARLVFQLTHANICQVLDLAESDDGTFIVMEFVDGVDLQSLIADRNRERLPIAAAVHVVREIALGLDYAHRRTDADGRALWLVHGDIKPENILVSREGEVKLADFGIARALGQVAGSEAPGNQLRGGTPGFIAPEARRGSFDQRADIYSLGVTLHVALGGALAGEGFDASSLRLPEGDARPLGEIIARATSARPEDRYPIAGELAHALSLHLAHRFPGFTAATLGGLVRTGVQRPVEQPSRGRTLVSLTRAERDAPPPEGTRPVRPNRTVRRPLARRRSWRGLAIAGTVAVVLAAGSAFWLRASRAPIAPLPSSGESAALAPRPTPIAPALAPEPKVEPPKAPTPKQAAARPASRPARAVKPAAKAAMAAKEVGFLTVHSEPWGQVFVDGHQVSDHTPLYRAPISTGTHRVTVYNPGRQSHSPPRTVVVRAGETTVTGFDW